MSEKKHIDRLFQEGFKDFEATPSNDVWKNIEAKLNKKKKRRVIPLWWRYAGIAALLLLLLTIGGIFKSDPHTINPIEVVNEDSDNNPETKTPDSFENNNNNVVSNSEESEEVILGKATKTSQSPSNNIVSQSEISIAETSASKNTKESQFDKKSNITSSQKQNNNVIAKNKGEDVSNKLQNNLNNNVVASVKSEENKTDASLNTNESKNNLLQIKSAQVNPVENNKAIAENKEEESRTIEEVLEENKELLEDSKTTNRWAVVPNAAPVYFNTLGQGSSIDPQFNGNTKSGQVNISYGISASYALNDKISIRSGINKVNLGYNTNDVIIFQTTGLSSSTNSSLQNISSSPKSNRFAASESVSIVSGENFNKSSIPESFASTNNSINQSFGFIEVPLEIQYALSNKKLGVNVIGGFSSFFLNNNEIFSESENGFRTFLGEARNLNKISYSANLGFGFRYKFSEKIDLNLEPMFKYQINTFNNTSGNFSPFFIGVYSGFAIKF